MKTTTSCSGAALTFWDSSHWACGVWIPLKTLSLFSDLLLNSLLHKGKDPHLVIHAKHSCGSKDVTFPSFAIPFWSLFLSSYIEGDNSRSPNLKDLRIKERSRVPVPFTQTYLTHFASLFTAICKASPDSHFAFLHFFSMGMVLIPVSCTMSQSSFHSSSGTLSIRSRPLNLFLTSTV